MHTRRLLAVSLFTISLALVGCGDNSDQESPVSNSSQVKDEEEKKPPRTYEGQNGFPENLETFPADFRPHDHEEFEKIAKVAADAVKEPCCTPVKDQFESTDEFKQRQKKFQAEVSAWKSGARPSPEFRFAVIDYSVPTYDADRKVVKPGFDFNANISLGRETWTKSSPYGISQYLKAWECSFPRERIPVLNRYLKELELAASPDEARKIIESKMLATLWVVRLVNPYIETTYNRAVSINGYNSYYTYFIIEPVEIWLFDQKTKEVKKKLILESTMPQAKVQG